MLAEKIESNRKRCARYKRAERVLRACRLRIFDYEDESPAKYEKARRVMARCQRTLAPLYAAQRAAAEDRKLQSNPSAFEPGACYPR